MNDGCHTLTCPVCNCNNVASIVTTTTKVQSPAPIQTTSGFSPCQQAYQASMLSLHNGYRSQHHAPPLVSDASLQSTAQKYAQYMADNDLFQHSGAAGLGENIAYVYSSAVTQLGDCTSRYRKF